MTDAKRKFDDRHSFQFFADGTARCRKCGRSVHSEQVPFQIGREKCLGSEPEPTEPMMTTEDEQS